jgi:hypothetical protein
MSGAPNLEPLVGQLYREIVQVQNLTKVIDGKIDAVETRVAQLDQLTHRETNVIADKIDKKFEDVTNAVESSAARRIYIYIYIYTHTHIYIHMHYWTNVEVVLAMLAVLELLRWTTDTLLAVACRTASASVSAM